MSYCIRCGRQTENEDCICDGCRARQPAAESAAGVPVRGGVPPALGGAKGAAPSAALPVDRIGRKGMLFSFIAVACIIFLFLMVEIFIDGLTASIESEQGDFILFLVVSLPLLAGVWLPLLASCGFSVAGIVCSSVALARRKRFRGWGEAVAGLIISAAVLLLMIFAAAIG